MSGRWRTAIALTAAALPELWPGEALVVADHGMHTVPTGGNHGAFYYQDLVVPHILFTQEGE
mgnify:FL=1|jgi:hypothetical protein